ncbi:MAG: hypothetical protein U9N33_03660 [Campylobacterota bacterium]|nr:hypothetical protein [Campylobacterota bacterium]
MLNDKDRMILSTLDDIKTSIELITQRCEDVTSSDDFLNEDDGLNPVPIRPDRKTKSRLDKEAQKSTIALTKQQLYNESVCQIYKKCTD